MEMSELAKRLRAMAESTVLCEEEYEDLLAAADVVERAQWRPIAGAPKDGTAIEAVCRRSAWVRVVEWDRHNRCWLLVGTIQNLYAEDFFTHYRPLPAPPEVKP